MDVYEERRLLSWRYESLESILHRTMEIRVAHITTINEEELVHPFLACRVWTTDKTSYGAERRFDINGEKRVTELMSEDGRDSHA